MLGSRAAAEAGPGAISTMSTPMPFLYQTRTLSTWSLTGANMANGPRYYNAMLRRHYSDFRSNRASTPFPRFTIKRTSNMSGAEPPSAGSWTFKPQNTDSAELAGPQFENISNSSTITRPSNSSEAQPFAASWSFKPGAWNGTDLAKSGLDPSKKLSNTEANDFRLDDGLGFDEVSELDEEVDMVDPFTSGIQPDEIQDLTRKHGARDSTITDQERAAFQKIFSDIFKRSNRSGTNLGSTSTSETFDDDPFERETEPTDFGQAKRNLGNILTTAMQRNPQSRAEMEAALEKYPPALRAAAAKAMGYIKDEANFEQIQSSRNAVLDMKDLETLREPERIRVEGLMNAASTDLELMEIMEKEVFSLISKLGLDGDSQKAAVAEAPLKSKKKKGWKKAGKARKGGVETEVEPQRELQGKPETTVVTMGELAVDGVSPLALYGPLYPSYLLLGLRLLDRSFAKPSPLALSILPRIKSLGYISQILGGSTALYNELLNIYRYRHDDFRGMLDLLNEMEHAALEFDQDTLAIVRNTAKFQLSIHRGEKGNTMKALWAMPEFAPNGFRIWREKIIKAIMEREDKAREHLQFDLAR